MGTEEGALREERIQRLFRGQCSRPIDRHGGRPRPRLRFTGDLPADEKIVLQLNSRVGWSHSFPKKAPHLPSRAEPALRRGSRSLPARSHGTQLFKANGRTGRKSRNQLQLPPHCLDEAAQCRDVHVATRFKLRNRVLPNLQSLGDGGLCLADSPAKIPKRHLLGNKPFGTRLDLLALVLGKASNKLIQRPRHKYLHFTSHPAHANSREMSIEPLVGGRDESFVKFLCTVSALIPGNEQDGPSPGPKSRCEPRRQAPKAPAQIRQRTRRSTPV